MSNYDNYDELASNSRRPNQRLGNKCQGLQGAQPDASMTIVMAGPEKAPQPSLGLGQGLGLGNLSPAYMPPELAQAPMPPELAQPGLM